MSSARTAERLNRILAMLPWVIANPGATVDEVCTRFGYQRSDLVRDLDIVFVCGLPGYGPGDLMDAYIDEDEVVVDAAEYFSRPLRLTAAEALMLLASGLAVEASEAATPALASAVAKLRGALIPDPGSIDVDLAPEPEALSILRNAARDGRVVEITHTAMASGRTTVRRIEPWVVFTALGNWYVSGHCRRAGAERVFRVDRVRSIEETDEHFEPPAAPPTPRVRYTPGPDDVTARIRLGPRAAWVADYYPVSEVDDAAEGRTIDFSAADPAVAARLLVRLGGDAELVSGSDVSDAVDDLRRRILSRYGD
ncbi:MAG TPA: WYL domain-containing protein [Acidimicrobiia bacterium]|nr:WYL domain-containing protein [Acidimicrobiia bacterium]